MEITPCVGIGDFLILKMMEKSNNLNIKTIHISKKLVYSHRKYPEQCLVFIQKLVKCLFPLVRVDVVDKPFHPVNTKQYRLDKTYIYDDVSLPVAFSKKPTYDNYIVFHTKVRMEKMSKFMNHDLALLKKFFATFKADPSITIILMGERVVEECHEQKILNIITIYKELLQLSNHNHVIDLTKNELFSGNPDFSDFINDIHMIHNAKLNITFGVGGNTNICHAFALNNLSFVGPISEFSNIISQYKSSYQEVEPFLEQIPLRVKAVTR
jgi:hypothetical protein